MNNEMIFYLSERFVFVCEGFDELELLDIDFELII